jgi:hypothetical protein
MARLATASFSNAARTRLGILLGGAALSMTLSVFVAGVFGKVLSQAESLLVFLVGAAILFLALGLAGRSFPRLDASFVFVVFLFAPVGRLLSHGTPRSIFSLAALPLGLIVAYLFATQQTELRPGAQADFFAFPEPVTLAAAESTEEEALTLRGSDPS